jgi:hypothetical protein
MFKNIKARKFSYKGREEGIIPFYSKNYVKEKEGNKNRKASLEPILVCAKKSMHDMFNMPMNEPHSICP